MILNLGKMLNLVELNVSNNDLERIDFKLSDDKNTPQPQLKRAEDKTADDKKPQPQLERALLQNNKFNNSENLFAEIKQLPKLNQLFLYKNKIDEPGPIIIYLKGLKENAKMHRFYLFENNFNLFEATFTVMP